MRLTADNAPPPSHLWVVFHVPTARRLKQVIWVDDEVHRWCEYEYPLRLVSPIELATTVHQARLIKIFLNDYLVLIDPVEDSPEATDESNQSRTADRTDHRTVDEPS